MLLKMGCFQRADRILCSRDFKRVMRFGSRWASGSFVILIASQIKENVRVLDGKQRRLGIIVSKQVGSAVLRNRLKRCVREWFRYTRERLPHESDVVVIARRAARDLSNAEILVALDKVTHDLQAQRDDQMMTGF